MLGAAVGAFLSGKIVNDVLKGTCYAGGVPSNSFICTHNYPVFLASSIVPGFLIGGVVGAFGAVVGGYLVAMSGGGSL